MQIQERGYGYSVANVDGGFQDINFIQKEEKEGVLETLHNGTTNEEVIAVLIDRLEFLEEKMSSEYNMSAIANLKLALEALEARTKDRTERGVEGTNKE